MTQRVIIPFLIIFTSGLACAQTQTLTIAEPGIYRIGDLFKAADIVAVVGILSGDVENYECAVYRGRVVQSFKGVTPGAIVYFGPYVG